MTDKILIVFYSHSGNTEKLAKLIQQKVGGTLNELQPEVAYPVDYNTVVEQAKKEIKAGFRPTLKNNPESIDTFDTVFVGTPNWWSTIAPPIATFLSSHDLSAKTVIPFCTHGGGGFGHIERDMKELCRNSIVQPGLAVYGSGNTEPQVSAWLKKLGIAID